MRLTAICFSLFALITSCKFKQFHLSDKDIQKHYAHRAVKPDYNRLDTTSYSLFYAEINRDKPLPLIVFIHGSPGAWYGFMKQMDDSVLQKEFRMISVDRPGFSKSKAGMAEPSIEIQAAVIAKLVAQKKQNQQVILLGRSYGSPIAAVIAAKHPELINGLVLVSSAVDPTVEKYFLAGKLAKKGSLFRGCIPLPIVTANDEKELHAAELRKILPYWKQIHQPVCILQAQDDNIVYPKNGAFLDSVFVKNIHHYIQVPKGGHLLTYKQPDLVRSEIIWLKEKLQ